jgi:hypothetical protein
MNASSDRLLRRTLWGNAVFSVISGAGLAFFAGPFARVPRTLPSKWRASIFPLSSNCWAWA